VRGRASLKAILEWLLRRPWVWQQCRITVEWPSSRGGPNGWGKAMLARSFLPATDLGISEVERDALIATLFAFERGR